MLKKRTVFVVGAGASAEFGLPVGSELQTQIISSLDIKFGEMGTERISGDGAIWSAITRTDRSKAIQLQHACWKVRDGLSLSNSIDNFIDVHRNDGDIRTVGVLAIAKAIVDAERRSRLFLSNSSGREDLPFGALGDTWLLKLFRQLQEGVAVGDIDSLFSNAAFVVFNYDRCVEHFLHGALRSLYVLPEWEASRILAAVPIVHPYGTIGRLPSQTNDGTPTLSFGADQYRLEEISKGISTYTEQIEGGELNGEIKRLMSEAEQVCFLGFSFQEQNMQLLAPSPVIQGHVLGTAFGLSVYDTDAVTASLESRQTEKAQEARSVRLDRSMTCAAFLDAYSRAFRY